MPAGPLRQRILDVLRDTDVEVEIVDAGDVVRAAREAEGDVVLVAPDQAEAADLDALAEIAQDADETGVAVVGEEDPRTRARLLAAGLSGVVSGEQSGSELAMSLEALADAQADGAGGGPEVGREEATPRLADFLTRSSRMSAFVDLVQRVVAADTSLLITGPTGVGKEHLARAIHAESPRASGPFVDVNCAALPEHLLEAELFGHRKGAFTGAENDRKGHFERADSGTIFLDEVGEMPLHLQVKLLTVLQRHEVIPVGAEAPIRVDVRVMAATNRCLEQDVADGEFREDLYYRLNVVPLQIPPLAERPEDVPELVGRIVQHFRGAMADCAVEGISEPALDALMAYSWPGNVRELINVVERAMLLGRGREIGIEDLPPNIVGAAPARGAGESAVGDLGLPAEWLERSIKEVRELAVRQAEKRYLRAILAATQGNLKETADRVGLSARALYDKMRRYGLDKDDFKPD